MKNIEGTVISGTMRDQDTIPAFLATALELLGHKGPDAHNMIPAKRNALEMLADITCRHAMPDYFGEANDDKRAGDVEFLFDTLDYLAPEGFYFGSHPGDGADYGFWQHEQD